MSYDHRYDSRDRDHRYDRDRDRDRDRDWDRDRDRDKGGSRGSYYRTETATWSWWSTGVSFVSMTLFASWFGIFGIFLSGLAYTDHKTGDYRRAKYKVWWAWFCAITGILVTIVAIVLLMIFMFVAKLPAPTFPYHEYFVPPWLSDRLNATG